MSKSAAVVPAWIVNTRPPCPRPPSITVACIPAPWSVSPVMSGEIVTWSTTCPHLHKSCRWGSPATPPVTASRTSSPGCKSRYPYRCYSPTTSPELTPARAPARLYTHQRHHHPPHPPIRSTDRPNAFYRSAHRHRRPPSPDPNATHAHHLLLTPTAVSASASARLYSSRAMQDRPTQHDIVPSETRVTPTATGRLRGATTGLRVPGRGPVAGAGSIRCRWRPPGPSPGSGRRRGCSSRGDRARGARRSLRWRGRPP